MSFIEARDLHKTYDPGRTSAVHALRGVGLDVEAGEMVALMGPSGSGKSTLMHVLGLLHAPDRTGSTPVLRISGRDMVELAEGERTRIRAREIGFVFQSYNLVPTLTAVENVALAAEYAGVGRREASRLAAEALARVGLEGRGGHRPSELSGGEQQRVAIARAIVGEPAILLADEPTGNLDPVLAVDVLGLIEDIHATGVTVLFATHDRSLLDVRPRRVVVLDEGRAHDVRQGLSEETSVPPRMQVV